MAKKKAKKAAKHVGRARSSGASVEATDAAAGELIVARTKVGATMQAMISFDGATHVEAVEVDAATFVVRRLA
jgi:hypothetical protein